MTDFEWNEIADVTGLTVAEFVKRVEAWPPEAKIWWDDDHVFVVSENSLAVFAEAFAERQ